MDILDLPSEIIKILKDHKIKTITQLEDLSRNDLKGFGLSNSQINQFIIKLQLNGLDIKRNKKSAK